MANTDNNKFTLSLPTEEEIKKEVEEKAKVDEEKTEALTSAAEQQVQAVMNIDLTDVSQRSAVMKTIENFGQDAVVASQRKNDFLAKRIATFKSDSETTLFYSIYFHSL